MPTQQLQFQIGDKEIFQIGIKLQILLTKAAGNSMHRPQQTVFIYPPSSRNAWLQ
jgi:hypothetical protein